MNMKIDIKQAGIKCEQIRNHWGLPLEAIPLDGKTNRADLVRAIEAGDPIGYPIPSGFWPSMDGSLVSDYWRFVKEKSISDCKILDAIRADITSLEAYANRVDVQGQYNDEPESLEHLYCAADFYEEGVLIASELMQILGL